MKNKLKERQGTTLVELLVTFMLLSIFLTSSAAVLGSYFKIFTHIRAYGDQKVVASTLLDTIEYELASARDETYKDGTDGEENMKGVKISGDGKMVYYLNQDSQPVHILAQNNKLLIQYQKLEKEPSLANGLDWYYGDGVYNGNRIRNLSFEQKEGYQAKNLVKVTLVLENMNDLSITYTTSRVIRCYNLQSTAAAGA